MNLIPFHAIVDTDNQEPADTLYCDWCGVEVTHDCDQLAHAPYCSIICAIDAEQDLPEWSADNV